MEEWRTIPSLSGHYEASSDGRIRRAIAGTGNANAAKAGHVLSVRLMKARGYRRVNLSIGGKRMDAVSVPRLVCEAFHGAPPTPKHTVNHKNGIRDDDRAENLEWATMREQHLHRHYVLRAYQGRPPGGYKLTEREVAVIKTLRRAGVNRKDVARLFGVTEGAIWFIDCGRSWRLVSPLF